MSGTVLNVFHLTHFLSILNFMHTNLNIKYISDFSRSNNANISTVGSSGLGIRRPEFSPVFFLTSYLSEYITQHSPGPWKWEHQFLIPLSMRAPI